MAAKATVALSAITLTITALSAPATAAPSTGAVLAEVYGGGGNSGATLTTDFVELSALGSAPASLDGHSVQYLPASPSASSRWQVTALSGQVQPGKRFLVGQARGTGGTVDLPATDANGTIAMAATAGTVALVSGTAPLTCITAADCAADSRIVDLVGYGSAVVREGAAAPATSNTTSVARAATLSDTDSNSVDFVAGDPTPTNAAGETPGGSDPGQEATIAEVQGVKRVSPLDGKKVTGLTGVVTAIRGFGSARGFWMQDPQGDDDPRTSEALFVYTGSTSPNVKVGDAVTATGTVDDFYPTNPSSSPFQSTTELTSAEWTVDSAGNELPAAEKITDKKVPSLLTAKPAGNIEELELDPGRYALDFWESREGMRVAVADAPIVGPTTTFNELYVTSKPKEYRSARGGSLYSGYSKDPTGVLKIESLIPFGERPFPKSNTGDTLSGTTAGVVEYDQFGGYTLMATTLGEVVSGGIERETTRAQSPNELAVATYNVENLDPSDDQAKFDALAEGIVKNLAKPDVVALEEVQDNNGALEPDDGVVAANETLDKFVEAIVAAGGPRYEWRQIDPEDGTDGGEPGGNIRVGVPVQPGARLVRRPCGRRRDDAGRGRQQWHRQRQEARAVGVAGTDRPGQRGLRRQPQAAGR